MVAFIVEHYGENDDYPIESFLSNLPEQVKLKFNWLIKLLEEKGPNMPSQYCKKLTGTKLFELICDYRRNTYRIFFFYHYNTIILLHGIIKKTKHTPVSDLELSERRMKEWLKRKGLSHEEV